MSRSPSEIKTLLESSIPSDILPWLKGVPFESLADILAPHALAPFKRSGEMHSSIGATEVSSPHQFTIWPSFIELRVTGNPDSTSILNKLTKICTDTWGITIPVARGYRRILIVSDTASSNINAFDSRGNIRDFGFNDPSEFQLTVPGEMVFPGSYQIDRQAGSWSCIIPSSIQASSSQEAASYAKRLDQIMTDLGNLWALERYEAPDHFSELIRIELVCRNFGSLVEEVCYLIRGKRISEQDIKTSNPVDGQFDGSNALFTKLIVLSFEKIAQLKGFFNLYRPEVEIMAGNWKRIRNQEGHEPSPLLRSSLDLGSMGSIVGTVTGKQVSMIALNMGIEIVNRTSLFPTSALQ